MNNQQNNSSGPPPIAFVLVAIGGGVVGQDYARGMDVDPVVGAGIGGVISMVLTGILYSVYQEREKIKETLSGIGAVIGLLVGLAIAGEEDMEFGPGAMMALFFAGLGYGAGQFVASVIVIGAVLLLALSQGPIGFMIRTWITGSN